MTVWYAHQVSSCSATKEATTSLNEPMRPTLDEALEYVVDDELVEVRVKPIPSHVSSIQVRWLLSEHLYSFDVMTIVKACLQASCHVDEYIATFFACSLLRQALQCAMSVTRRSKRVCRKPVCGPSKMHSNATSL